MRQGKACAWGPTCEEVKAERRTRRRLKLCLEQVLPEASEAIGVAPPPNIASAEERRAARKRKREEDQVFILPHLASPSPPRSTAKLAPMLALPTSYVDILTNTAMRHSLGDDTMETGLQRTANELLDGEKGLMQALGRLREVLRLREADTQPPKPKQKPVATYSGEPYPPLPRIAETDNLWRVNQELLALPPPCTIEYTATPVGAVPPYTGPEPVITPVHKLFISESPAGMTLSAIPPAGHPGYGIGMEGPGGTKIIRYNLDLPTQVKAVDDAMERIAELLADCNEYKERLEEARDRVADVSRARKKVWSVIKDRASRELDAKGL
jgi:hypothetical protein